METERFIMIYSFEEKEVFPKKSCVFTPDLQQEDKKT